MAPIQVLPLKLYHTEKYLSNSSVSNKKKRLFIYNKNNRFLSYIMKKLTIIHKRDISRLEHRDL